jgi:NAD(P)-dependent dehydrogenase (short-subunit alcohol dehydrogenase family)
MTSMTTKVAVIAGASSGLNLGVALGLCNAGWKVSILSRSAERIAAAQQRLLQLSPNVHAGAADVRDYAAIVAHMGHINELWGPIDLIISGAAGNFLAPAETMSANAFKTIIDIDLLGTFNVFRAGFDALRKPGGSMIAISAPQGERAYPQQSGACAAKAGVNMLVKTLAIEWGAHGIRVNAISPGPIEGTEGVARLWPTEEALTTLLNDLPVGMLGQASDISDAVDYLSSSQARYVTGHILNCDGGFVLQGGLGR